MFRSRDERLYFQTLPGRYSNKNHCILPEPCEVSVNGTLFKHGSNYEKYLGESSYLGIARTVHCFRLCLGLERNNVFLFRQKGKGRQVKGQLFLVNYKTEVGLDILEGIAEGHYVKTQIKVRVLESNKVVLATVYLKPWSEVQDQKFSVSNLYYYSEEVIIKYPYSSRLK